MSERWVMVVPTVHLKALNVIAPSSSIFVIHTLNLEPLKNQVVSINWKDTLISSRRWIMAVPTVQHKALRVITPSSC